MQKIGSRPVHLNSLIHGDPMTFKTIITSDRTRARACCDILLGTGQGAEMFPSGLAAMPEGPATHWIGSGDLGQIDPFSADKVAALVDLYACCDISDEQNFTAMARMGLVLVEEPML